MQPAEKKHIVRRAALTAFLAAICIGLCELAFCRFENPRLYHTVVDPVVSVCRETARQAGEQAQSIAQQAGARLDAVSRQLEERAARASQPPLPSPPPETAKAPAPSLPEVPAGPSAVTLTWAEGQELLSGGAVPLVYYNQSDPAWAKRRFGNDPIDAYGCGPTAMAMVVSTLTGKAVDPAEMAAAGSNYSAPGQGSYLSIVPGLARRYGLSCAPLSAGDPDQLRQALSGGGIAVALMGVGHFTQVGHFILLHGLTPDGQVLAADPNSRPNSLTPWDPSLILEEAARLWLISPAETNEL